MALTDLLQSLGGDEDTQAAKLQEILSASTEAKSLATSVQKLEERRDQLLEEKKKLARAKTLLVENGIDPDDDNAEALLKARLAAKGEPSGESDLQVIEMKSSLSKLNTLVTELKTRAEQAEKEKEDLKAKKVKADIKQAVLAQLDAATAGVCLSKSRLFQLNESSFVMADDGQTVLWKDGDDLKTVDDFATASASNPEDAIFWAGRGSSGSGTPPGRNSSTPPSASGTSNNPFTIGGNGTEASKLLKKDRRTADRLIAEARSKGKLDPAIARMLQMQS
jgi:hypothetical protein